MKLPSIILFLTFLSFVYSVKPKLTVPVNSINRPVIHFTPPFGWMNDPNGLWYDETDLKWHLYYQYNPNGTVWALPLYWGHATSVDGLNWENADIAIDPIDQGAGAYSGSAVIDEENTSGFFGAVTEKELPKKQRVIAIWTFNAADWAESQYISYSINKGYTFKQYRMNPVASMNSTQFRDPQVIRYKGEAGEYWVMSVAKSHQFKIQFYKSTNLKNWKVIGSFSLYGFLGYQYECPNLVKMPYTKNENLKWQDFKQTDSGYLWVLFISINPGSMQGGSSTQYFIGNFDGENFTPIKNYAAPIDYGKDFYALQIFFNSPNKNEVHGIAWTSNWQYSGTVPTDNWRSSMSLIRKFTLGEFQSAPNTYILFIKSEPLINDDMIRLGSEGSFKSSDDKTFGYLNPKRSIDVSESLNGALKFELTFTVEDDKWDKNNPAHFYLDFKGNAIPEEYIRLGFEAEAGAFFLDRSHTNVQWVHDNPFFTDKLSVNVQYKSKDNKIATYSVLGFIDRNIIELYFNDGYQVATNTFFMTGGNFIGSVDIILDKMNFNQVDRKYNNPFTIDLEVKQILDAEP